ncbi:MAG: ribokinase [Eubacteriales bacterium]|nr:ribokinase [Eubacteriales bacterium]
MKVLSYGSLNIDNVYTVDHFVRSGETMSSLKMEVFSGGKGLNQSIALAKSGVSVWHAGAVGKKDGDFLLEQLEEVGVHTELISKLPVKTGHAIIQRDREGQNCILLFGGANQQVTREQADHVMEQFSEGDFLILQNEISEIGYIMQKAHEKKMKIVLNPSPMDEKIFTYPLDYVDYFILNEIEARDLCGHDGTGDELLELLAEKFPMAKIVLTLGEEGSIYKDQENAIRQPIFKVDVVDTTAAGDTFTGFFIGGLVLGETPRMAMENAAKASAIAVTRPGAAPSIPYRKELSEESSVSVK